MTLEIWDSPGSSMPLLEDEEEDDDPFGEWEDRGGTELWGVLVYRRRRAFGSWNRSISHSAVFARDAEFEERVA